MHKIALRLTSECDESKLNILYSFFRRCRCKIRLQTKPKKTYGGEQKKYKEKQKRAKEKIELESQYHKTNRNNVIDAFH